MWGLRWPHCWSTSANPFAWQTDLQKSLSWLSPSCPNIPMNWEFAFKMLVNQLTCKCWLVFGIKLIIALTCVESPLRLTLKSHVNQNFESSCLCSANLISMRSLLFKSVKIIYNHPVVFSSLLLSCTVWSIIWMYSILCYWFIQYEMNEYYDIKNYFCLATYIIIVSFYLK
jgi:hypothetical protein